MVAIGTTPMTRRRPIKRLGPRGSFISRRLSSLTQSSRGCLFLLRSRDLRVLVIRYWLLKGLLRWSLTCLKIRTSEFLVSITSWPGMATEY